MSRLHVLTVKSSTPVRSITSDKIDGGASLNVKTDSVNLSADVPTNDDFTVTVKSGRKTIISVRSYVQPAMNIRVPDFDFDDTVLAENNVDELVEDARNVKSRRPIRERKPESNGYESRW
jgi:hypothetical protein